MANMLVLLTWAVLIVIKPDMERFYKEFGRLLRGFRDKAHLSQLDVAKRVGLSRTSITNIELGRQQVSLHLLFSLASAVGTTPELLLPANEFALPEEGANVMPTKISQEIAKLELSELDQQWIERVLRKSIAETIKGEKNEITTGKTS
jgi:transcriptional regulator with XRE-family HTH domain